ncbi:MAG: Rdx family protein [Chloroflexota bacterium]
MVATWMAAQIFAAGGPDVAITITPGGGGVFQIYLDGEKVYDKKENDNKFPDLPYAKTLMKQVQERLGVAVS